MDGFARRREQSKESIRKAARELFSRFGVEKVSVAQIARQAGVSTATIYNNYEGKEALVREFVSSVSDQLVRRIETAISGESRYQDKIRAFVQAISDILADPGPPMLDGSVLAYRLDLQEDPEMRKIRSAAEERMSQALIELVREGKQQGQVDPDLSEDACRIYFLAFMRIFVDSQLQHRFLRDPVVARDLGALMISGLGGK